MSVTVTVTVRTIVNRVAVGRLVLGWGAVLVLAVVEPRLQPPISGTLLVTALAAIIGVILVSAFGVVREAEHLARRLGDPYGSLVLTLSIVIIEVILIAAVMLGPGDHTTIGRDSVFAVSMIILNAVIGLSLLVGGIRHGGLRHNRTGTSAYFTQIVVLASLAFVLPGLIGQDGTYTGPQRVVVVLLTVGMYAFFLVRQMGPQADDFREVDTRSLDGSPASTLRTRPTPPVTQVIAAHRTEILLRTGLLVATVLPIVLLSQHMAVLIDDGLGRLGAPVALAGLLIATIVFLPETITSVRAALQGEMQRVSNLCHGALVSTVGLTIPSVLVIGSLTGQAVVLAVSPTELALLTITIVLTIATFGGRTVTAVHGAAHLVVFAAYGMALFA